MKVERKGDKAKKKQMKSQFEKCIDERKQVKVESKCCKLNNII